MFTRLAQMISVVLTGLIAGLFAGRWFGAPASRDYTGPVFTEVQQRIDRTVGQWAPGLILGAIALLALTLVLLRRESRGVRFLLTAGALLLVIGLTVTTQVVNVPINEEINGWSVNAPPADWTATRDRWESFHTLRTAFAVVAFCLVAASVTLVGGTRRAARIERPGQAAGSDRVSLASHER